MIQQVFAEISQFAGRMTRSEKLQLIEYLARSLQQDSQADAQQKKTSLDNLRHELAPLPVANPDDGLSNRDHDRLIYGDSP